MKLGVPTHGAAGPGHVTFSIREAEMASWRERLAVNRTWRIEKEVDWPGGGTLHLFQGPGGEQRGVGFASHLAAAGADLTFKSL